MQINNQAKTEGTEKTEAFLCPFCGAPYRELIPVGVVQVKCNYCGATVLVPPRLGGLIQRCPNHPDTLAIGLCNDCGKSYCGYCLYIYEVEHGKLHLCAQCYKNRTQQSRALAILMFILSLMFVGLFLVMPSIQIIVGAFILLATAMAAFTREKRPTSAQKVRSQSMFSTSTPKSFLKRCVKCGSEIPIASENCKYCGAKQPEYKAYKW